MANSLNVVLVQPYLDQMGGAERVILEVAERFNAPIYTMAYRKEGTYPEFAGLDIRPITRTFLEAPAIAAGSLDRDVRVGMIAAAAVRMLSLKMDGGYDVINAHLIPSHFIRNRNERVAWYCHGICRPAYNWRDYFMAERGLFGKALLTAAVGTYQMADWAVVGRLETICANSEYTKKNIAKYSGRGDAKVITPALYPKDFSCDGYGKFFFYPSRIAPEKRMELAIDAFRKFSRKGWRLVIGGHLDRSPRNLDYLQRLRRAAAGLEVEFELGLSRKRLTHLYANCYATLFPSMREDFGIVPLESMASSKPCIAWNEGGPAESIVSGKTGFLVNSTDEMAGKMRFLAEHPDECEKMGRAGRKRVEQNYTWKIFLEKMGKAFRETANGKDGS